MKSYFSTIFTFGMVLLCSSIEFTSNAGPREAALHETDYEDIIVLEIQASIKPTLGAIIVDLLSEAVQSNFHGYDEAKYAKYNDAVRFHNQLSPYLHSLYKRTPWLSESQIPAVFRRLGHEMTRLNQALENTNLELKSERSRLMGEISTLQLLIDFQFMKLGSIDLIYRGHEKDIKELPYVKHAILTVASIIVSGFNAYYSISTNDLVSTTSFAAAFAATSAIAMVKMDIPLIRRWSQRQENLNTHARLTNLAAASFTQGMKQGAAVTATCVANLTENPVAR